MCVCMKTAFSCILNAIIGCVGVKWNRAIFQSMGGHGICQQRAKAREWGEGVGGGNSPLKVDLYVFRLSVRPDFVCLRNNSSVT